MYFSTNVLPSPLLARSAPLLQSEDEQSASFGPMPAAETNFGRDIRFWCGCKMLLGDLTFVFIVGWGKGMNFK